MDLPEKAFRSLISADNLYITDEQIVVDLIVKYLKHRDHLPILDEDNPMKNWDNLTEEERKKREEEDAKAKEEETKLKEAEAAKEKEEFDKLDDLGKIQFTWNKKVQEIHHEATDALSLKRLNKEQRKELFKCIRYSYLHHEKLLLLTADPLFELAKNFIVEGLTHKLGTKDGAPINQKLEININPRVYYDERMIVGNGPSQPGAAGEAKPMNPKLQGMFD
jgi:DNA-directed RNA polymerase